MRFTKMLLPAILLICLIFSPSGTEAQESVDYWEFSLDDLLNANVSTVSKKKQSISEAPAIVSVITEEQIKELGVQSLTQLMAYIPGFTVIDTYWKPGIVTARGIKMTLYNDKILMLINGVPAYDAAALEHYLDTVPLKAVKRLEIIRGPGSTLYGTNAFAAVINVITKDGKELDGVETEVSFGSFGKAEVGLATGGTVGELEYFFSGHMVDDDGETKDFTDETNTDGRINYENDVSSLLASLKYKEFKIDMGYSSKRYGIIGPVPVYIYGNDSHIDNQKAVQSRFYVNGIFEHEINDKMSAKAIFRYDDMDKWRGMGKLYHNVVDTNSVEPDYARFGGRVIQGEVQGSYMISDNLSFLGGIAGETRLTDFLSSFHDDLYGDLMLHGATTQDLPISVTDYGVYIQADGTISKLGYVAGVRANYLGTDEEIYLTPRAGVVYNHSKKTSLKLLYGQAFRSPGPQENFYQVPKVVYGTDAIGSALKPEFISSTEVALDQQFLGKYNIRVNGFMTKVSDVIGRRAKTQADIDATGEVGGSIYDNLGAINITGVESELRGYPMEALSFFINMTFKTSVDDDTDEDVPFTSNIASSGGVTYKGISKLSISPNYQFVGERANELAAPTVTVDPFFLLNLRVGYQLSEQLEIALVGQNLLDEEYFYPEQVRGNIETIPGGYRRAMFVSMSYKN